MKSLFTLACSFMVLVAGLSAGCQSTGSSESAEVVATGTTTSDAGRTSAAGVEDADAITTASATLWVQGMSCPLCATNIDKQLLKVPGVRKVSVDLGSGKVVVDLKDQPKPSRASLARAIRDSGFTLSRIETP